MTPNLTQELVRKLFNYLNGELIWNQDMGANKVNGLVAGYVMPKNGYKNIRIFGKNNRAHSLVFLWHHGYVPKFIDHIDLDKLNNKIENLRECTSSQNNFNTESHKNTTSVYKGVCWCKKHCKWEANMSANKKRYKLGLFRTEVEAAIAYDNLAKKLHGEFINLNIKNA